MHQQEVIVLSIWSLLIRVLIYYIYSISSRFHSLIVSWLSLLGFYFILQHGVQVRLLGSLTNALSPQPMQLLLILPISNLALGISFPNLGSSRLVRAAATLC